MFRRDRLAAHVQKMCPKRGVKCLLCDESVVRDELRKHIAKAHPAAVGAKARRKGESSVSRGASWARPRQSNRVGTGNKPAYSTDHCYHCGRPVMPGSSACYLVPEGRPVDSTRTSRDSFGSFRSYLDSSKCESCSGNR